MQYNQDKVLVCASSFRLRNLRTCSLQSRLRQTRVINYNSMHHIQAIIIIIIIIISLIQELTKCNFENEY